MFSQLKIIKLLN